MRILFRALAIVLESALMSVLFTASCSKPESRSKGTDPEDEEVVVESVSLNKSALILTEGESFTLIATVLPEEAQDKALTWSSSDESVAVVSTGGIVLAKKEGKAAITAAANNRGKTATCAVTVEAQLDPSVTIGATHISCISAVLSGKANLGKTTAADLKMGIMYSRSSGVLPSTSTMVEATEIEAEYYYNVQITGLEPNTIYYYRSYVYQGGENTYGETKSFLTKDISTLIESLDADSVKAASAVLNAVLDLTDVSYENLLYGFYYGTNESYQNAWVDGGIISENHTFSSSVSSLSHKSTYWFHPYVRIGDQEFSGEVKSFKTGEIRVDTVTFSSKEYKIHDLGGSLYLSASIVPSDATDKSVSWASDKEDVATVDANGRVTAKGNGTATITVTTNDQGKTASCVVTVAQWVTGISLDNTSITLNEGQEQTLTPTVNPSNAADKTLIWTSSNPGAATVDAEGKVTAVSKGTATIRATANDGSGKFASCSVTVKRPVSSIQLNKSTLVLYRGTSNVTETLTATVTPSDASNTAVTWNSSNTSVAAVSSSGVVTGKSKGTATITVTAKDGNGAQATCAVEVKQYVTSISLDKTSIALEIGAEATLSVASVLPENANDKTYTWSSSDSAIASVDNSGKVTARANGNATIKAAANDGSGVFASCSVIVFAEKVDMGIKTSDGKTLYWSTRNLCESGFVNSPEEYGDYYAWGETEPKSYYSWATYKFGTSESGPFSKYNTKSSYGTVDSKTVLDPEDDVAHVKLGGNWRMPTYEEWEELRTKCTWAGTDNYRGTGIAGRIVTAPNGNSIFLPAAGIRGGTNLGYAGSFGFYWSSSLNTDYPYDAWECYGNGYRVFDFYRYSGQSVRPVSE